jgi:Fe(3+) dicitrate transport protein
LVDAKYTKGEYKGNYVEYAPKTIERVGMNYYYKGFAVNAQYSYHGKSFGDAGNTVFSEDALVGEIPAYNIVDLSASYRWSQYKLSFGINNLTNNKYFTLRTDEYPGPGIIPASARMFYGGFTLSL